MKTLTLLLLLATQSTFAFAEEKADHLKPAIVECKIAYRLEGKTKVFLTLSGEDSGQENSVPMNRSFRLGGIDAQLYVARNLSTGKFTAHYIHQPSLTVLTASGTARVGDSLSLRAHQLNISGLIGVVIDCDLHSTRRGI